MTLREWLMTLLRGQSPPTPNPDKEKLTRRQLDTADRLAEMRGTTRDEVLAEAYRRADRILATKRR